eukprot:CAMPEP_0175297702 /NCGR_PEP_ID=MMETSP0093-20121207/59705_1 /TAXON_ID=311494 /ORGANISM="Alexandrium monilatum, Strain CCMP3105" /LENGTH=31 /DNA_ID= /DNA_START= /DNA_END= /DNA_ORIENTATION=
MADELGTSRRHQSGQGLAAPTSSNIRLACAA